MKTQLSDKGLWPKTGTAVDATLINAPSSTKNTSGERDPEMHQTKKGNQWYFGMKAQFGVDADSGLVHSVITTAANVSDMTQANARLYGQEVEPTETRDIRSRTNAVMHEALCGGMWRCPRANSGLWTSHSPRSALRMRYRRSTSAFVPRWSICLGSSSSSSDLPRCAT